MMNPENEKSIIKRYLKRVLKRPKKREEEFGFKLRTLEELNSINPQIQTISQKVFDALRPFKKEDFSWVKALRVAGEDSGIKRWLASEARRIVWESKNPSLHPLLPLVNLFDLGAVRADFDEVDGQEKLVLDFPLNRKYEREVACFAFGDNEPGTKEVHFTHKLWKRCSKARLPASHGMIR